MIKVHKTYNSKLIKEFMYDEEIRSAISNDYFDYADWEPEFNTSYWFVAMDDFEPLGIFIIQPYSTLIYELHVMFKKGKSGKKGDEALEKLVDYLEAKTPCKLLIGLVPAKNKPALVAAKRNKFKHMGELPLCFQKDQELDDMILIGRTI